MKTSSTESGFVHCIIPFVLKQNKVEKMYLCFGTFLIKQLSHSPLLDINEMIVSNSTGLVGYLSSHI